MYRDIAKRNIVLYGDIEEIENFIEQYKELLKIEFVITDHKKEVKLQAYAQQGIQTIMVEDVILGNELIVICDKVRFDIRSRRLRHLGKKEYAHYISQELVNSFLYHKPVLVCMGTQLLEQVSILFKNCEDVTNKYDIICFRESDINEPYMNRKQEYIHVCKMCKAYIRSACEKNQFSLKVLERRVLKEDCKIITVADYGFAGYFPQIERDRDAISDLLLRERERLKLNYETLVCARADKELELLCKKGYSTDVIVSRVLDEAFYSEQMVQEHFSEEVNRFKALEKNDDIKLADFIEKKKGVCLCKNLNEWNEPMVSYVAESILGKLGFSGLSMDVIQREKILDENAGSEILIYPSVKKWLGLKDDIHEKKYRISTYYSKWDMSEEEYVRYMVEYMKKALDIIQFMGVDEKLQESLKI